MAVTHAQDTLFREGIECAAAAAGLTVETWCYRLILQYVDLAEPRRPRVR